jgi:ATP-dependent RNA helicase DHX37/DHR1
LKGIEEIRKLRAQLTHIVKETFPGIELDLSPKMKPPTEKQFTLLRQVVSAGFVDQIAVRKDVVDSTLSSKPMRHCRSGRLVPYVTLNTGEDVYIHPTSVLVDAKGPGVIAYSELMKTGRAYMKGNTVIEPSWLGMFAENMCHMGKPIENPPPK